MNPLRFGIVGCGSISGAHVRALQSLAGKAELVAVADIRPEAADALASQTGAKAYGSIESISSRRRGSRGERRR